MKSVHELKYPVYLLSELGTLRSFMRAVTVTSSGRDKILNKCGSDPRRVAAFFKKHKTIDLSTTYEIGEWSFLTGRVLILAGELRMDEFLVCRRVTDVLETADGEIVVQGLEFNRYKYAEYLGWSPSQRCAYIWESITAPDADPEDPTDTYYNLDAIKRQAELYQDVYVVTRS